VGDRGLHPVTGEEPGGGSGAEHVAAPGRIQRVHRQRRNARRADGGRVPAAGLPLAPAVEPGRRDVGGTPGTQRHHQERDAGRHRFRGERERIGGELAHLILVELDHVEAAEPLGGVGQGLEDPESVVLHAQKQTVQVGVDRPAKPPPERLRGAESKLESGDEVDVERVEVGHHGAQLAPGPGRHAARHPLGAPLVRQVVQHHPVVRDRHLDAAGAGREPAKASQQRLRPRRQVVADLDQRHDLPARRHARVEARESVGDAAPFLHRRHVRIAVNLIPDE